MVNVLLILEFEITGQHVNHFATEILPARLKICSTKGPAKNLTIPSPVMGKIVEKTGLFNLTLVTDLGEGKLRIQTY